MILDIVIIALLLLDLFMTHSYLQLYKTRFPKNDWTLAEANPIIRLFIKRFGLTNGIGMSGIVIMIIVVGVLYFLPERLEASKWFFVGLYYSVNVHHYVNNRAMKKLIREGGKS